LQQDGGKILLCIKYGQNVSDAPPSSLMDSIASPKVKTMEGKKVGACFLARSTSRLEMCAGVPR